MEPNLKGEYGRTLISYAKAFGHESFLQYLTVHGADLNIKDEKGMTAFLWACQKRHKDVVQLLLDHSEEHRIDLNSKDKWENTAFIMACDNGHKDVVKLLLNHSKKNRAMI